jgi:spore maturation protein CgeB
VWAGLCHGLLQHGVEVIPYSLAARIDNAAAYLNHAWRRLAKLAKRAGSEVPPKPTHAEVQYNASIYALDAALRHQVDAVLIVSAMFFHPNVIHLMKRAGLKVFILFTESPYDIEKELARAQIVDGCWTNERSSVKTFRAVNPCSGYVPHAWHPDRHRPGLQPGDEEVPAYDVVFVGSAFHERITWFESIDWTGISLALYGTWDALGSRSKLRQYVRGGQVDNRMAAALYRRAKIGLNLYRTSIGWGRRAPSITHAESLNPRAYELAACGAFSLSDFRAEVPEVFGDLVPTFRSPTEAAALIRLWLANDAGRAQIAEALPACVAEASWAHRAQTVIGDIETLLQWDIAPAAVAVGG